MGCQKSKPVALPEQRRPPAPEEGDLPKPKSMPELLLSTSGTAEGLGMESGAAEAEGGGAPDAEDVPPVRFFPTPRTASTTPGSGASPVAAAAAPQAAAFRAVLGEKGHDQGLEADRCLSSSAGAPCRQAYDAESDTFGGSVAEEARPALVPLPPAASGAAPGVAERSWSRSSKVQCSPSGADAGPGAEELPMPQMDFPRLLGRVHSPMLLEAEAMGMKGDVPEKGKLRQFPVSQLPQRTLGPLSIWRQQHDPFELPPSSARQQCTAMWGCLEECTGKRKRL